MKRVYLFILLSLAGLNAQADAFDCSVIKAKGIIAGTTNVRIYINPELDVEMNFTNNGTDVKSVALYGAEVKEYEDGNVFVKRYGPDGERREFKLTAEGDGSVKLYDDTFFGLFGELTGEAYFTYCQKLN